MKKVNCNQCLNSGIECAFYGTSLEVAKRFCRQDNFENFITREMLLRKGECNETPKEERKAESKPKRGIEKQN